MDKIAIIAAQILDFLEKKNMSSASGLCFSCLPKHYDAPSLLNNFVARDGQQLGYRFYDSTDKSRVFILLHGSSAEGEYLHPLANHLSQSMGQVYVPNLRGHFASGKVPGDCNYIGQLEDDLCDLINHFTLQNKKIYLVGHSSGGGLSIRFSGGPYGKLIHGAVLLSPAIPTAPTMRQGNAGGWAKVSQWKIVFLLILNCIGIRFLNHTKVIQFNRPVEYCNGKETLSYSYNLNSSYHPRIPYQRDIPSLKDRSLVVIGSNDEANDPALFSQVMQDPQSKFIRIIPGAQHLDISQNPQAFDAITHWVNDYES